MAPTNYVFFAMFLLFLLFSPSILCHFDVSKLYICFLTFILHYIYRKVHFEEKIKVAAVITAIAEDDLHYLRQQQSIHQPATFTTFPISTTTTTANTTTLLPIVVVKAVANNTTTIAYHHRLPVRYCRLHPAT